MSVPSEIVSSGRRNGCSITGEPSDVWGVAPQITQWLRDAGRDRTEAERLLIAARLELELMRTEVALRVPRHVHDAELRARDDVIAAYRRKLGHHVGRRAG